MTTLVRGGAVPTASGALERADVLIRDGDIEAVGTRIEAPDAEVLDAAGTIVAPGRVNAHDHSNENFNPR